VYPTKTRVGSSSTVATVQRFNHFDHRCRGTIPHEKDEDGLAPPHGHLLPPVHEPRRRHVLGI
jgi:hypothetical protein